MALTDGYLTIPQAVEWLDAQGYVVGAPTLRKGCLIYLRKEKGEGLPCETISSGNACTYYVRPDDVLVFAKAKYAAGAKRGAGRPMGTVGIKRKKHAAATE